MFETTRPFLVFDYLGVPYAVTGTDDGRLARAAVGGRELLWCPATRPVRGQSHFLGDIRIFGPVVGDAEAERLLPGEWSTTHAIRDADGKRVGSIRRSTHGDVFLPFDPDTTVESCWSEAYADDASGTALRRLAMRAYYSIRPAVPRSAQIAVRRAFARVQARAAFPRWPVETGLHDLLELVLRIAAAVAEEPIPWIWHWPNGRQWALVLTHDVETQYGYEHIHVLRDVEAAAGFRSSWNLVPRRYAVDDDVVRDLQAAGFEVGVHGLYHDGRDLVLLEERLPEMLDYARRWGSSGFRSPATHRNWELMPRLGFDYDSSYPDTDPYEPQAGGCCSWLPFFNDGLVELPITLVQDHTLFVILRRDGRAWREKAELLRQRGGMALLITHPDYMVAPERVDAYRRFLESFKDDATMWRALPREVSSWWRRRSESRIERADGGWQVVGPAAGEARVELAQAAYL